MLIKLSIIFSLYREAPHHVGVGGIYVVCTPKYGYTPKIGLDK